MRLQISFIMGIGGVYLLGFGGVLANVIANPIIWVYSFVFVLLNILLLYYARKTRLEKISLCCAFLIMGIMYALIYPHTGYNSPYSTTLQSYLHEHITGATGPSSATGFVESITIGYKSGISASTRLTFQKAGLSHLLTISGYHISVICMIIFLITRTIRTNDRLRNLTGCATIIILWAYAAALGFQPSITRAVLMFTILQVANILRRRSNTLYLCLLAATLMLIANPTLISSISFQLTFSAVIGITQIYIPINDRIVLWEIARKKRHAPHNTKDKYRIFITIGIFLLRIILISIACTLFTLPLTSYYFGSFSIIGPLTNIIANLFTPILLALSFIWWCISFINIRIADFLWIGIDELYSIFYTFIYTFANLRISTFYLIVDKTAVLLMYLILFALSPTIANFCFRNISRLCICIILLLLYNISLLMTS